VSRSLGIKKQEMHI